MSSNNNNGGPANQVNQVIKKVIDDWVSELGISVAGVARQVQDELHPNFALPPLSDYLENMQLRQMARAILRRQELSEDNIDHSTEDMFGAALQVRYPTMRLGQVDGIEEYVQVYVKREDLTYEERMENSNALRMEADAKVKHANALDAETEYLLMMGKLSKAA
jgi:hypothetical protein